MSEHIMSSFDEDLKTLRRMLSEMGGIAERMLSDATQALATRDIALAQAVIAMDPRLDTLQRQIEEKAVLTIARRQPMSTDLRNIVSSFRIASDLERVGDLAKNVGKRVVIVAGQFHPHKIIKGVEHMSNLVLGQLKDVLDAYTEGNNDKAMDVWQRDGEIDSLYTSLFRELLTYMMEDPRNISFCTHLLFAAKNIERIGDHTTNIAETIHYVVTGQALPTDRPKRDTTTEATGPIGLVG
jgi:phosphate transport system protein